MTTSIKISGQINGNSTLAYAIADGVRLSTSFYGYEIVFKTKKAAKKALWDAFAKLRSDKQDAQASMLHYYAGASISYDASRAEISECSQWALQQSKDLL